MCSHSPLIAERHPSACQESAAGPAIIPPKPVMTKGRPRKKRLASAIEPQARKKIKLPVHHASTPATGLANSAQPSTSQTQDSEAVTLFQTTNGRRPRHCRTCGEAGHYATTCSRTQSK
jgi:hypothetical protein